MKKLVKNRQVELTSLEAYGCGCSCTSGNCSCSCGGSATDAANDARGRSADNLRWVGRGTDYSNYV